jgi:hypothetical protein
MANALLPMAQGEPETPAASEREPLSTTLPAFAFAIGALVLGVYIPGPINDLVDAAARQIGG